jgi:ABC-type amino acid transport substrate-binding protein
VAASDFLIRAGTLTVGLNDSNFILVRGDDEQGQPTGIASDVARALASRLGVRLVFQRYASAGALGDAIAARSCDAGFLGAEPLRADRIAFSKPYLDLEAGFILANDSAVDGVHLISVQKVTVRASPQSEDWRGVCSRGERKCLSRFEFLLVS